MNSIYYVYILLDPRNSGVYQYSEDLKFEYEPFYVGKGKNRRYKDSLKDKYSFYKKNKIKAIKNEEKEPITIFIKTEIEEHVAFDLEIRLIKIIGRRDKNQGPLCNLTNGGDGSSGTIVSEETKNKRRGPRRFHHSEETKNKIRLANTGHHRNLGRKNSEETKIKMRKPKSHSHSAWNKGKKMTEEEKYKMDLSGLQKGRGWNKDKKLGKSAWNKGSKGIVKPNITSFKKGRVPHNKRQEISTVSIIKD